MYSVRAYFAYSATNRTLTELTKPAKGKVESSAIAAFPCSYETPNVEEVSPREHFAFMKRLYYLLHLEFDDRVRLISVGMVFHEECSGFFVAICSYEPSFPASVKTVVIRNEELTRAFGYPVYEDAHKTGTKHLKP